MLVHSILCMFTPLPSVSQHALASSTHKGRGFLLCSGCSLNHFGDFLLQRVARLHSLSTGENGLPGSFDVCWRDNKSLRCAIEEVALNYVLWRDRWYQICVLEGKTENYMCTGGKTDGQMCAEGKSEQTAGVPSSAHQKREIGQAFPAAHIFECSCPPAHTYSGSFSFGLREWTITKLSRPFFSIEQSR